MKKSDIDNFMDKVQHFAEETGKYVEGKVRVLPDDKIIKLARDGNRGAQEEAERRGLRW